jgi:hypothetical protein
MTTKDHRKRTLSPEEEIILLAADIRPDQTIIERIDQLLPQVTDWNRFASISVDRAASPLILQKFPFLTNAHLLPDFALNKLKQARLKTLSRNMVLTEHFRQVVQAFAALGIPVIALKGAYLSNWLYQDIGLRQFSDLDLLVPEKDGIRAVEELRRLGYEGDSLLALSNFSQNHLGIVHYPSMHKNGVSIEVHIRITGQTEPYKVDLEGMRQRAIPLMLHGVQAYGFCPNDLLMHLCLHLDKHFVVGHVQFTCFYDLTNLLNHRSDELDWELFEAACTTGRTTGKTYKYLMLVHKFMNAHLPEEVIQTYSSCLKPSHERIFLKLLNGQQENNGMVSSLKSLKGFKNPLHLLRFIGERVFPSKAFMIYRYNITKEWTYPFFYIVRSAIFIKSIWNHLRRWT